MANAGLAIIVGQHGFLDAGGVRGRGAGTRRSRFASNGCQARAIARAGICFGG